MLSSPFLCLSCLTINLGLGDCPCTTAAFDYHPEKPYFVRPVTLIDMMIIITINICNKVRRLTQGDGGPSTGLLDLVTKQFSEKQISTISMYTLLSITTNISQKTKHFSYYPVKAA